MVIVADAARKTRGTVIAGLIVLSLAGCSPERPTVINTPELAWLGDIEPSSSLETNEFVKVLRGTFLGTAMAANTGDFTIEQLTDFRTPQEVARLAKAYASQGNDARVYVGPIPFQPLAVDELDDGVGAAVRVCELDPESLFAPLEGTTPLSDREGVVEVYFVVEADNGVLHLDTNAWRRFPESTSAGVGEACDRAQIPIGLFTPVPELPDMPVERTVRDPLGAPTEKQPQNDGGK